MTHEADSGRDILIAGLGSIGRRHLRNLRALGWPHIRLYRTGHATLPDDELGDLPVDRDLDRALDRRPLAVIVANPTARHLPVAIAAARAGAHLLIEKPVSHSLEGIGTLEREVAARGLLALVGFQFRFHPAMTRIKAWLDDGAIGSVVSAQAHWGEFLPGMHPWEDYRRGYAARADLGGGVLLTLCHPIDYLRWLLGEIDDARAWESGSDALALDVDTCVDLGLRFASGATGHVHLDFVQQPPEHRLTLIGTHGTITWNAADHTARCYRAASGRWEQASPPAGFDRNVMFVDEMRHFLACLSGRAQPICTLRDGRAVLEVVAAIKEGPASAGLVRTEAPASAGLP